jgi:hypothetical protein
MSNEYKKTLARFERAVREHEMMGTQPPEAHSHIQREYEQAKHALTVKLAYRQKD